MPFRYSQKIIQQFLDPMNTGIPIIRRATDLGDGTGIYNIIGDYSSAPKDFYIQPPTDSIFIIEAISFTLSVTAPVSFTRYGSITGLPNGIQVIQEIDGTEVDLSPSGTPITCNCTLFHLARDVPQIVPLQGDNILKFYIDFGRDINHTLKLIGPTYDKLIFRVNDDFDDMQEHTVVAHGYQKFVGGSLIP